MKKKKIKIALLMTEGSPLGLKYLEIMMVAGFFPDIIILSRTKKLSQMARETVLERTNGTFEFKEIDKLLSEKRIPVFYVENHNSLICCELLKKIDIAILGGTGIIKKKTIASPRIGIINTHPGLLPKYRGCNAVEWSLYNNDAVGATCHFVDEGIDSGDIITSAIVKIENGDEYWRVRLKAYNLQAEVLIKGLKIVSQKNFRKHLRSNTGGNYYSRIDDEKMKKINDMLNKKTYKHYYKSSI